MIEKVYTDRVLGVCRNLFGVVSVQVKRGDAQRRTCGPGMRQEQSRGR